MIPYSVTCLVNSPHVSSSPRLHSCSLFCSSWWQMVLQPVASVSCRSLKQLLWPQQGSSSTRFTWRLGSLPLGMFRLDWTSNHWTSWLHNEMLNTPYEWKMACLKLHILLASNLSLWLLQDMCASSGGLWWSQHWTPNKRHWKGMQCSVWNTRQAIGYDW